MLKQKVWAERLLENKKMFLPISAKTRVRLRQWQDALWDNTTDTTVILSQQEFAGGGSVLDDATNVDIQPCLQHRLLVWLSPP